jgi:Uma2 family endonuclease
MADLMTTTARVPKLHAGDVLTRDEFERRYAAMPDLKKAELVEGVVYVGSAVPYVHGRFAFLLAAWSGFYCAVTPVVHGAVNSTVRLDFDNEAQPDVLLRLPEEAGGRSRITADDYLEGPPELVIEIAANSASYDLHQKLRAYRRNGVLEYVVYRFEDRVVDWFVLERGTYERQTPDENGLLHSRAFPGLALDLDAFLGEDLAAMRAAIERATDSPEHAAFVQRLRAH